MNIKLRMGAVLATMMVSCCIVLSQNIDTAAVQREMDAALIDAIGTMDKGDYRNAVEALDKIIAADPGNDAALYYSGMCDIYLKNFKSAQAKLKKAAEIDPKNYWYKDRLAIAYSASGEDELTIATFEELLKEHPKKNDIYYSLVNLYLKQNQFDKALEAMDQIETVFGKNENVTSTRYDILLRQNKPAEALQTLLDYNKDYSSPRILSQIGDHTMAEYKDSLALGYYEEALELQSNYVPAILGKSEVYRMRRNYPGFFSTLKTFISDDETFPQTKTQYMDMLLRRSEPRFIQNFKPQLDSLVDTMTAMHPADSSTLTMAGMYYYSTERKTKAIDLFKANKELDPDLLMPTVNYVQLLTYVQDWDKVVEESEAAFGKFPDETGFLDLQNMAYYNKKEYSGIVDNCRRILSLFPKDTSKTIPALATLGDMYHELGDVKGAFKAYDTVLKLDPDNVQVLNNYAYYLALKGKNLKKAYSMSKKTIEKEPDNPTYLDTVGWILHLMGRNQEAKTHFKHAMLYGGKDSATCLMHYSIVLEALGETDLSKVYKMQAEKKEAEGKE